MRLRLGLLFVLGLAAGACNNPAANGDGGGGGEDMAAGGGDAGGGTPDLALPPNTVNMRLVESAYDIPAGMEFYQCQRITLTADVNIVRITPVSPQGVHHEVLAIENSPKTEGTSKCQASDAVFGTKEIFASGVNSPSLDMPPTAMMQLKAGQQIQLNLHLFNASTTQSLKGTAAIDVAVATTPRAELVGTTFAGIAPIGSSIPASAVREGVCTVSRDTKLFAVFPHMHQTGKHIKIIAETGGGVVTIWDRDYDFQDQKFGFAPNWDANQTEVSLKMNDKLRITCTYTQDGVGKQMGDSSDQEMCFGISYVYPPIANTLGSGFCVQ
jgi:hypothetical protein